ncbi:hypothetical protein HCX50_12015 [Microbacterium oxydans]|uniref:hypothetical protein n=1 Tax=Microbacterium sp. B19(2022) TaxID=2914045 RepID=UPI0014306ED7|nr:hypothetical protein [Microbacterium sp. B19(2022)]NJI60152.1 hypothetical protein [Microbacterium sp. B19(2022)]
MGWVDWMSAPDFVFAIGTVLGDSDSESLAWKRATTSLSKEVRALAGDLSSPVRLNVIFHIEGKIWPLKFHGIRARRINAKRNLLVVDVGIAKDAVSDYRAHLLPLLVAAVSEADTIVSRKFPGGLAEIRAIVARLPTTDSSL